MHQSKRAQKRRLKWLGTTKMSKLQSCEKWQVDPQYGTCIWQLSSVVLFSARSFEWHYLQSFHHLHVRCSSSFCTVCVQGMPLSFDTSHNKKVEGNYSGLVKRDTKRSARQYMNRIGHAPLFMDPVAITPSHQLSSFLISASTFGFRWLQQAAARREDSQVTILSPTSDSQPFSSIRLMKDGGFGLAE